VKGNYKVFLHITFKSLAIISFSFT